MMSYKLLLQIGWIFSVLCLFACTDEQTGDDKRPITIGMIHCCDKGNVYMDSVREDIEQAAHDDDTVKLLLRHSRGQQALQNKQISQLITQGVDALLVSMVDNDATSSTGTEVVNLAKSADVPIVFYNHGVSQQALTGYDKAYYVGSIPAQAGILQGKQITEQWQAHPEWDHNANKTIEYVLLRGPNGHPDADARSKWVKATIEDYPGARVNTRLLATATSPDWSRKQGRTIMQQWLRQDHTGQIELVVANNDDMAIGALEALRAAGRKLPVFGVDAIDDARTLIEQGHMSGTVFQNHVGQGKEALNLAKNLARGNDLGHNTTQKIVDQQLVIPYSIVDKSNVGTL